MAFASGQRQKLTWSEDGTHFAPIVCPKKDVFVFGSLYVPYDPLFGNPVADQPVTSFWGFEREGLRPGEYDVVRIEWGFGPAVGKPDKGANDVCKIKPQGEKK